MKRLSRAQEVRSTVMAICVVCLLTFLLRHQVDFSDNGVVVIWTIAMLILTAAIRRYYATSTGEDGMSEMERHFKFFQRIFPSKSKR
jgi:hypothetical protein